MLTFDARLTLRLSTTKGDDHMSDQWIQETVKRIRDAEEEKKRRENFEYMREQKLNSAGFKIFEELQKHIKDGVTKLNEKLGTQRLSLGTTRYDEMTVEGANETELFVKFNDDAHYLEVDVSRGDGSNPRQIPLGFNEDGDVRFINDDRPASANRLAELLLDALIDLQLAEPKPSRRFSFNEDV